MPIRRTPLLAALVIALVATVAAPPPQAAAAGRRNEPVGALPTPADFVTQQYEDFLARSPDVSGLAYWTDVLGAGLEPAALVEWLALSDEFSGVVAPVVRLYRAHFLRPPDPEGLAHWTAVLRSGVSLNRISEEFVDSAEFEALYGAVDDDAYVELVYRNVFDRSADPSGAFYWQQRLAGGMTRGELMAAFSDSAEYRDRTDGRVRATMLYVGMLRRSPDAGGLDYWSNVLDGGVPYRNVIAGFLGASEYTDRIGSIYREIHPLTGVPTRAAGRHPALAVKIDNVDRARPQQGIGRADVVYEEMVEGNLTRLIAVFHSDVPTTVGPVRSIRTTDIDVLAQLNTPLLAASGANSGVLAAVAGADVVNVNATAVAGAYHRRGDRRAPHNLYADTGALYGAAGGAGGTPPALFRHRAPGSTPGGVAAAGVDIAFGLADIGFRWSAVDGGWRRTQNGTAHTVEDGTWLAPENVVVLEVTYGASSVDARSPEAHTVGTGVAHVFSAGRRTTGSWTRATADEPIRLLDGNGNEVALTRGRTFVELAPVGTVTLR
ncbi:MAG: DUF4214 domain-containing protein [Actinomycetota bacterium]